MTAVHFNDEVSGFKADDRRHKEDEPLYSMVIFPDSWTANISAQVPNNFRQSRHWKLEVLFFSLSEDTITVNPIVLDQPKRPVGFNVHLSMWNSDE